MLSVVGGALLFLSFGMSSLVSLGCGIAGIVYSRRGRKRVDQGLTPKHRGLAQAGFVIGIITLVISAIVTILGIIFVIALATDESFRRDFENDNNNGFESTGVRTTIALHGLAVRLLS